MLRNAASREPQSCTITSFTRLPVVSGPGVSSSGSPVSEAAGVIFGIDGGFRGIYHIISQIRANVARTRLRRKRPLSAVIPEAAKRLSRTHLQRTPAERLG